MAKPNRKLRQAIKKFSNQKQEVVIPIQGILGLPLGGSKLVDVPNRKGFVYVRLRDNTSEVIQAYNSEVSSIYGLAVLVVRQNNIYKVLGRDQDRYQDWGNIPYLPKHGGQHSFNQGLGMGADITWVYTQQFMPLLGYPSGTNGSNGIVISPYTIRDLNGNWKYVGNTGTPDITMYRPSTGTQAVMVLVYIDSVSGNPYLLVGSGSYFSATLTGSSDIAPYIPPVTNPNWIPDTAIRLTSGTTQIFWGNMYDVRPFLQPIPTGSGGGGGSNGTGFVIWDEGIPQGTASILNVVSDVADISISGTVARLFITGSASGGGINTGTLDARYLKLDTSNDPLTGRLRIIPSADNTDGLYIQTHEDATNISIEQLASGTSVSSPGIHLLRESVADSSTLFSSPLVLLEQNRISGSATGEMIVGVSDGTKRFAINPSAQGTGTLAYFDGDFVLSPSGLLLLLENHGVSKFYVNASGTAYSNGVPLIKEAPTGTGLQYARKNAGWEPVTSSGGSSGTFLVTEDLTSQINGSNINFVLSNFPDPIVSTRLYYNGVRQRYLFHYTVSGSYVQTLYTPTTGSVLTVDYTESSSTGTINGLILVQDEGVSKGNVNTLNFVGAGVDATVAGAVATIVVTGTFGYGDSDPYGIFHRITGSNSHDDEFITNTASSYTQISPQGTGTWNISNHTLNCVFSGQAANDFLCFVKPMTLADGEWFEINVRLTGKMANYNAAGIIVTDGTTVTSNGISAHILADSAGSVFGESYKGTVTNMGTSFVSASLFGRESLAGFRVRLKRISSTSFQASFGTPDGAVSDTFGLATLNPGFTPTHAGVFVTVYGGAHKSMASFDFIRHMS